jgi:hypothetical protein
MKPMEKKSDAEIKFVIFSERGEGSQQPDCLLWPLLSIRRRRLLVSRLKYISITCCKIQPPTAAFFSYGTYMVIYLKHALII